MSIGFHLWIIGRPGCIAALHKILGHVADRGNAWIARRIDIANHWRPRFPRELMFKAYARLMAIV
jgi:hypothetical protein